MSTTPGGWCYCTTFKHSVADHPLDGCLVENCCKAYLTPAAQAVLEAVGTWEERMSGTDVRKICEADGVLLAAIRRYRETLTP